MQRQHSIAYISQHSDIHIQVFYIQVTQNILTWKWGMLGLHCLLCARLSFDQDICTPLPPFWNFPETTQLTPKAEVIWELTF
jgi:hypothetical protein